MMVRYCYNLADMGPTDTGQAHTVKTNRTNRVTTHCGLTFTLKSGMLSTDITTPRNPCPGCEWPPTVTLDADDGGV